MSKQALIVSKHEERFIQEVAQSFLVGWDIKTVDSIAEAEIFCDLRIAIVDFNLGGGRDLLKKIHREVPRCYNMFINYSSLAGKGFDVTGSEWLDDFVLLEYIDSDPQCNLMQALSKAERWVLHG